MNNPVPSAVPAAMRDTDAAEFLATLGVHVSPATLRCWRTLRYKCGPRYAKENRRVLYARSDLEAWAKSRDAYKFRTPTALSA